MAFPPSSTQQEINRKILEDLQLKRQQLQKGVNTVADINNLGAGINTNINQMPTTQLLGQPSDYPQSNNIASGNGTGIGNVSGGISSNRAAFSPTPTATGYFIAQDSHYGNPFIPVLPRFD